MKSVGCNKSAEGGEPCSYYDSIANTLGDRFRVSVRSIIQTVIERPESFGRIGGEFRGALVDRFPYVVVFYYRWRYIFDLRLATRCIAPQ